MTEGSKTVPAAEAKLQFPEEGGGPLGTRYSAVTYDGYEDKFAHFIES